MGLFKRKQMNIEEYLAMDFDYESLITNAQEEAPVEIVEVSFDDFLARYPDYRKDLKEYMSLLSTAYEWLTWERYRKIRKDEAMSAMLRRLGFGMLMRHAMEAISADLFMCCGGKPEQETVHERLKFISGAIIPGRGFADINLYDSKKDKILRKTLDYTNEVAHPHVIGSTHSYEDLYRFYETQFSNVVTEHIKGSRNVVIKGYLRKLKNRLDNFDVGNKLTRTLMLGGLVRQLTECATNWWCCELGLTPTEISTRENPITIRQRLIDLSGMVPERKLFRRVENPLTANVIFTLFTLKNASNGLMHMPKGYLKYIDILKKGRALAKLNSLVQAECSAGAVEIKFDRRGRLKKTLASMSLCGLLGWTGAHNFYTGNLLFGIMYPVFYMILTGFTFNPAELAKGTSYALFDFIFLILPIGELIQMHEQAYISRKWGRFTTDGFLPWLLFWIMLAIQCAVFYLVFFGQL